MSLKKDIAKVRADKIPPGWVDRHALARSEGLPHGDGSFFYTIKHAIAAGLLEARYFRVAQGNGIRPVRHYRRIKRKAA